MSGGGYFGSYSLMILKFEYTCIDMLVDIKRDINHDSSFNSSQEKPVDEYQLPAEREADHKPKRSVPSLEPIIALLVIACNRPTYIRQTLDTLLK